MLIWKTYTKTETYAGIIKSQKTYKRLLLFGIIPLFVNIDG